MAQLKALLWLKWRLTVRAYERSPMRLVGLLFVVLVLGSASLGLAAGCFAGFVRLPEAMATELLHVLLLGIWCFWLLAPVFGFPLSEGYDITKQLAFPIPRLRMFVANMLSNFISVSVIFLLPLLAAIVMGFSSRADVGERTTVFAAPLIIVTLAVFVVHLVSLGETLLLLLLGVLRSRRYQDVLTIFLPFIGVMVYFGLHLMFRATEREHISLPAILAVEPSRYLTFTPSGLAANAIDAASFGEYPRLALALALLVAVTGLVLWAGSHLMQRVYRGEIVDSPRLRPRAARERRPGVAQPLARWLQRLPPPLLAVTQKELRYLWRDPQMKSALLGLTVPVVWLMVAGRWHMQAPYMPALIGGMFIFAGAPFCMNIFGYDREGLTILFLFPPDRRLLLIGKNVLGLVILIGASTVGLTAAALWLRQPEAVPKAIPFLVAASLVSIAGGNVASVYFPLRIAARGENPFSRAAEKGCLTNLIRAVVFQCMMVASLPIAAGFFTPYSLRLPALYLLTGPVSLLYGAAVYAIVLPYVASALVHRETQLIEVCTAPEEV